MLRPNLLFIANKAGIREHKGVCSARSFCLACSVDFQFRARTASIQRMRLMPCPVRKSRILEMDKL
jgi:hypothetical protein